MTGRTLHIAVIFASTILAAGCARPAYVVKSDAGAAWMRGHIARVHETVFDYPADAASLPDTLGPFDTYTVLDYNRVGNITRTESFKGPDSVRIALEEYFYDPSGERIERAVSHNISRHGTTSVLYNYNEDGLLTTEAESNGFYRFDQRYDRHGYLKTRTTTSPETEKNVVIARYGYDREGRLRRLGGERREKYRYHPGGAIAEIRTGRNSLDLYDERGNLVSMAVKVKRRNAKGRVYERFPVTLTADYEYDAQGNWIRRVQLYKGEMQNVAVRKIEYYEDR